jgi:geranylgeranyl diphosphate synthase type I
MTERDLPGLMLESIEQDMRSSATLLLDQQPVNIHDLVAFHLGWETAEPAASGKRIRPLLLLLCCAAAGGDWETALPAASAVEWLHNFSLVHDDIEDDSRTRRGRETLWARYGVPLALNAGDALFALSRFAAYRLLENGFRPELVLELNRRFDRTSLLLTQGQHQDMVFEDRDDVTVTEYLEMIEKKTAALIECACACGASLVGAELDQVTQYAAFGKNLGLAFQILDDQLGIWGNPRETGKARGDDILARKKSLPILLGLQHSEDFRSQWQGTITLDELELAIGLLEEAGIRQETQSYADRYNQAALDALALAQPANEAGEILEEMTRSLLHRKA